MVPVPVYEINNGANIMVLTEEQFLSAFDTAYYMMLSLSKSTSASTISGYSGYFVLSNYINSTSSAPANILWYNDKIPMFENLLSETAAIIASPVFTTIFTPYEITRMASWRNIINNVATYFNKDDWQLCKTYNTGLFDIRTTILIDLNLFYRFFELYARYDEIFNGKSFPKNEGERILRIVDHLKQLGGYDSTDPNNWYVKYAKPIIEKSCLDTTSTVNAEINVLASNANKVLLPMMKMYLPVIQRLLEELLNATASFDNLTTTYSLMKLFITMETYITDISLPTISETGKFLFGSYVPQIIYNVQRMYYAHIPTINEVVSPVYIFLNYITLKLTSQDPLYPYRLLYDSFYFIKNTFLTYLISTGQDYCTRYNLGTQFIKDSECRQKYFDFYSVMYLSQRLIYGRLIMLRSNSSTYMVMPRSNFRDAILNYVTVTKTSFDNINNYLNQVLDYAHELNKDGLYTTMNNLAGNTETWANIYATILDSSIYGPGGLEEQLRDILNYQDNTPPTPQKMVLSRPETGVFE
jgi:hypothetical protein